MGASASSAAAAVAAPATAPPLPPPPELPPIDGAAIAALVIFLCSVAGVIALVLWRPVVTLRLRGGRPPLRARVPHWVAPPAGALLLLAARALDGPGFVAGLRGDAAIQPWAILVLFLSLAYCAAALDQTGAFAWLALRMTRAASTGPRLFALHSALSGAVTLATRCGRARRGRGLGGGGAGGGGAPIVQPRQRGVARACGSVHARS